MATGQEKLAAAIDGLTAEVQAVVSELADVAGSDGVSSAAADKINALTDRLKIAAGGTVTSADTTTAADPATADPAV